jgi:hypothetical protein
MTTHATTVAPPQQSAARRFSESMHVLVDPTTRAYVLGRALIEADQVAPGSRPKEGATMRELIDDAVQRAYKRDREAYEAAVQRGRAELDARAAAATASA